MKPKNKTTDEHEIIRMEKQMSSEFAREIMRGLMEAVEYTKKHNNLK